MTPSLHIVHVRVNDAATGQPTPVRIRFTDSEGRYYAPFGRLTEFFVESGAAVGGNLFLNSKRYAYIDGTCEIQLPSGQIFFEIHKGPEYVSVCDELMLAPGQASIRLEIERWSDLRKENWFPGDTSCAYISPHAALLEAAGEDLAVVNLLIMEGEMKLKSTGQVLHTVGNLEAFSGQEPCLEKDGYMVVVNSRNHHPTLGVLNLLNCHRVVFPLSFGGPDQLDNWTLADWCDQCHRKSGLVVWSPHWDADSLWSGEPPADLVLGKIDAFELNAGVEITHEMFKQWYGILNLGFQLPLVGAGGKGSNRQQLGDWRTYARLNSGEAFTYKNWIEAIRTGRTFATKGPLLSFKVEGIGPGGIINLPSSRATVHVCAEMYQALPPNQLQIIVNGKAVIQTEGGELPPTLDREVAIPGGGWLAAAYWGHEDPISGLKILAHTSPVYVRVEGQQPSQDPQTTQALTAHFDKMLDWIRTQARVENEEQRSRLARVFESAKEEVKRRLVQHG
jgi:hypothetical protein